MDHAGQASGMSRYVVSHRVVVAAPPVSAAKSAAASLIHARLKE